MSESDPFAAKTPREIADELQAKADEAKKFADDFDAAQVNGDVVQDDETVVDGTDDDVLTDDGPQDDETENDVDENG